MDGQNLLKLGRNGVLSSPIALVLLASLVGLGLYALYVRLLPKPIPGIPYNPASARNLLGDIPILLRDIKGEREVINWLLGQLRKANTPIYQMWLRPFGKPLVMLSDYREGQDIMLRRGKEFDRSERVREALGPAGPNHHILRNTDAQFRMQRKLLQDLMSPSFLHNVAAPNIYASAEQLIQLWKTKARISEGRPFDALKDVYHAGLDAVLEFGFGPLFVPRAVATQLEAVGGLDARAIESLRRAAGPVDAGRPVDFKDAPLDELLENCLEASYIVEPLNKSPAPRLTWQMMRFRPKVRRIARLKDQMVTAVIQKAIGRMPKETAGDRGDEGDESWVKSAADHVVYRERQFAQRDGRAPAYTSGIMKDEIFGFIIAGYDTTSTTLAWGLKLIADNQRAQTKLREALRAAYTEAASANRAPSVDEIIHASVPYLDATIEEILRCSGTIPLQIRDAVEDTTLLGHRIPKGTSVYIFNQGHSFREPAFKIDERDRSETGRAAAKEKGVREWDADNMDEFAPERWLVPADGDAGRKGAVVFDAAAGPSLPFGLGVRGCYGRRLAYLELRILIVLLYWNFKFLPCPEELSTYDAIDGLTHKPQLCYARLQAV